MRDGTHGWMECGYRFGEAGRQKLLLDECLYLANDALFQGPPGFTQTIRADTGDGALDACACTV
jgi:hypothetical protein